LFLVFDPGAVEWLARDRVRAKISALRRNLAKQALHFAPDWTFTYLTAGHDALLLEMGSPSSFLAKGNGFI
jgi:hypothetical protein